MPMQKYVITQQDRAKGRAVIARERAEKVREAKRLNARGLSKPKIANALGVTPRTILNYLKS